MQPVASPPPAPRSRTGFIVGGIVLLAVVAVGASLIASQGKAVSSAQLATEARVNVLALCDAVQAYRDEHGSYVTAGPQPREVPRSGLAVPFPEEGPLHVIGFAPGPQVHFQYEVTVQESPVGEPEVTCIARTDADGDGLNAVYRVRLDANGMTSSVQVENEGE